MVFLSASLITPALSIVIVYIFIYFLVFLAGANPAVSPSA